MDPVQHFDIPYRNRERAKKFYFQAFGWQIIDLPGSSYSLVGSVQTEPNGMPKRPGAINGGLAPRGKDLTAPSLYVRVGDLKSHLERIRHAGGTVLMEPVAQGPVWLARFRDPEGNVMTAFQQNPAAIEAEKAGAKVLRGKGRRAKGKKAAKSGATRKAAKAKTAPPAAAKGIKPQRKAARKAKAPKESKPVWSR